jgi:hypothetical protein
MDNKMSVATSPVFVDEAVIALADTMRILRDTQKALAAQEAELRAELISVLGNARVAFDASGAVVYELVEAERRNTNLALLESAFAEAYEATVSVKTYDKLELPKK